MQQANVENSTDVSIIQIVYQNWRKPIFGLLILFAFIITVLFFNKNYFLDPTTSITVNVHGNKGKVDNPLKEEGMVYVKLFESDYQDSAKINAFGEAVFPNFPSQYLNRGANLSLNAKTYQVKNIDSVYKISKKNYLEIKTKNLDRVWGRVFNKDTGDFLEGVEVILGDSINITKEDGKFNFNIPENRNPELILFAKKTGFVDDRGSFIFSTKIFPSLLGSDGQRIDLLNRVGHT